VYAPLPEMVQNRINLVVDNHYARVVGKSTLLLVTYRKWESNTNPFGSPFQQPFQVLIQTH
jgi:hypothetical protein